MSKFDLPTAAEYEKGNLPPEVRAKINKRNSQKGGAYERDVGKKLAAYHGFDWTQAFLRTKRTTGGQPHGDLMPIMEMYDIWKAAGLGPIECKNQKGWSFDEVFKRPNTCTLIKFWLKSNDDTNSKDSIVFFTKSGVKDYVLRLSRDGFKSGTYLNFEIKDPDDESNTLLFTINTLDQFLEETWSRK